MAGRYDEAATKGVAVMPRFLLGGMVMVLMTPATAKPRPTAAQVAAAQRRLDVLTAMRCNYREVRKSFQVARDTPAYASGPVVVYDARERIGRQNQIDAINADIETLTTYIGQFKERPQNCGHQRVQQALKCRPPLFVDRVKCTNPLDEYGARFWSWVQKYMRGVEGPAPEEPQDQGMVAESAAGPGSLAPSVDTSSHDADAQSTDRDGDAIRAKLSAMRPTLLQCLGKRIGWLTGELVLAVTTDSEGAVTSVDVIGAAPDEVKERLSTLIREVRFPSHERAAVVASYRLSAAKRVQVH